MTQPSKTSYLSNPFALGFFRASLMFPLEHFVDMTKIAAQKSPHLSSRKVIEEIYKEKGFKGFLVGAIPNYPRRVARDTLRWPVIGYSYHFLTSKYPETFPEKSTISSIFSGIASAFFDALVLGPLELLMAYRISEKKRYKDFVQKQFIQEGLPSLYRGACVNLVYRSALWGTYMGLNNEINKLFDSLNKNNLPPYSKEITSAIVISTTVIATLLPVDFVKTQIQMNQDLQRKKISFVVSTLLKQYGFSRFYAGAPIIWINNIAYALVFQKIIERTIKRVK